MWRQTVRHVSVAEAKAKFSEIIQAVEAGEDIRITRHGTPVVRLMAEQPKNDRPVDLARLRRWRAETPPSSMSAVDLIRADRDAR
jgi:prevent-host-death family protein